MKKYAPYLLVLLAIILVGFLIIRKPATPPQPLTTEAPWSARPETLKARLAAINLPALPEEGNVLHIHQHLNIFVHGNRVQVPADVGIHKAYPPFISIIHTHDTSGIIHVESPTVATFTLGQFFDIWGVRFTSSCLGGYCSDGTNALAVYVNGEKYEGDPRALELGSRQVIVVTYGTEQELPSPMPSTYSFPDGY